MPSGLDERDFAVGAGKRGVGRNGQAEQRDTSGEDYGSNAYGDGSPL
jgi:hypothetical protein